MDPFDLGFGLGECRRRSRIIWASTPLRCAGQAQKTDANLWGWCREPDTMIPEGAPLTPDGARKPTEGLVTACVFSTVLDRWVGLALLENGHARHDDNGPMHA